MAKPKVFVNSINKSIKNNKESYYYKKDVPDEIFIDDISNDIRNVDVNSKINALFDSESFVYKSSVYITLKDGTKTLEDVIAVKDSYLITLSDKKINISDIKDIKKAN